MLDCEQLGFQMLTAVFHLLYVIMYTLQVMTIAKPTSCHCLLTKILIHPLLLHTPDVFPFIITSLNTLLNHLRCLLIVHEHELC